MYSSKQRDEILKRYVDEMEVLKARAELINVSRGEFGYLDPVVEFKALQLRMIIEHIVLCSLITNAEKYREVYHKLGEVWNIKYICNDIKRINPQYLPVPVIDTYFEENTERTLDNNTDAFLSEEELLSIHASLGKLLHAQNPFSSEFDYQSLSDYITNCNLKIAKYLTVHVIHLFGENDMLFVAMNSAKHNGQVFACWLTREDEDEV